VADADLFYIWSLQSGAKVIHDLDIAVLESLAGLELGLFTKEFVLIES
jgi:hypothetical protein